LSHIFVQKMAFSILVREIDDKIIKIDNYIIVKFAFYDKLNDAFVKKVVTIEIHIIDDFAINLFLDNDVLCLKKIDFHLN